MFNFLLMRHVSLDDLDEAAGDDIIEPHPGRADKPRR